MTAIFFTAVYKEELSQGKAQILFNLKHADISSPAYSVLQQPNQEDTERALLKLIGKDYPAARIELFNRSLVVVVSDAALQPEPAQNIAAESENQAEYNTNQDSVNTAKSSENARRRRAKNTESGSHFFFILKENYVDEWKEKKEKYLAKAGSYSELVDKRTEFGRSYLNDHLEVVVMEADNFADSATEVERVPFITFKQNYQYKYFQ